MSEIQWYEILAEEGAFGFPKGDRITAARVLKFGAPDHKEKPVKALEKELRKAAKEGKLKVSMSPKQEAEQADPDSIFSQNIQAPAIPPEHLGSPELLLRIHEELSKTHLLDDDVKLTAFLVACTAYLNPSKLHMSIALKGGTTVGKDNLIKTTLRQFPSEDWLFLTNATTSTMEDDIGNIKVIAFSEINLQRDDKGANAKILETIKQMAEGGTSSIKKDLRTGFKTTNFSTQEQKSIIYSTTETQDDEELVTRFIIGSVEANQRKVRTVNDNTLSWFAGDRQGEIPSWIPGELSTLKYSEVFLPYANLFKGTDYFDSSDPRSMRDVKRLLSIATAVAWLHQNQRKIGQKGEIISEPFDFLAALIITGKFFNHTYQGLGDQRLQRYIDAMNTYCEDHGTEIFPRHAIQESLGLSINTIKALSKGCQDLSIIRFDHTENSIIYYRRCQKGVKRVLMGVNWKNLIQDLFLKGGVNVPKNAVYILEKLDEICKNTQKDSTLEKFDTPNLTPQPEEQVLDVRETIKSIKGEVTFEKLLSNLPGWSEADLTKELESLSSKGHIFQPQAGFWRVLE